MVDEELCIACDLQMIAGQKYYNDVSGGVIHADCCGEDREGYVGSDGESLDPADPLPTPLIWEERP